jgi:hypothetical protein
MIPPQTLARIYSEYVLDDSSVPETTPSRLRAQVPEG